jgi:hypothetical protein
MGVENWDRGILLNTKLDNTFGDSSVFPNENARMKVVPIDASVTKLDCLTQRCADATSKL